MMKKTPEEKTREKGAGRSMTKEEGRQGIYRSECVRRRKAAKGYTEVSVSERGRPPRDKQKVNVSEERRQRERKERAVYDRV